MKFCIIGVLLSMIISPVVGVTTYHWKTIPERPAVNDPVTVLFWLEDFKKVKGGGMGELKIFQRYPSRVIFYANQGICWTKSAIFDGSESKVTSILCDHRMGTYSFKIAKLRANLYLSAKGKSQKPKNSDISHVRPYKPPSNVYVRQLPQTVNIGDEAKLECRFRGGKNSYGYFSFNRVNSSKPFPKDSTLVAPRAEGAIVGADKPDSYGTSVSMTFIARPGDDGWYQCHVVYDPSEVGNFTSSGKFLNVVYAPMMNHTDGHTDHLQADIGENITFSLPILANPVATAVWIKSSSRLQNAQKFIIENEKSEYGGQYFRLSFEVEEEEDFGLYKCIVTNGQGQQTASFLLNRKPTEKQRSPDTTITTLLIAIVVVIVIVVVVSVVVVLCFKRFNHRAKTPHPPAMNARYQANGEFREVQGGYMEPTMMNGHI